MVKYIKDKTATPTDWISKEKRELFAKAVNTCLMRNPQRENPNIDIILDMAKKIVDRAFENYPDTQPEEVEEELPL